MEFTKSQDGRYRATIRVEHRIDAEMLAEILVARAATYGDPLPTMRLSKEKVEEVARRFLYRGGFPECGIDLEAYGEVGNLTPRQAYNFFLARIELLWPKSACR